MMWILTLKCFLFCYRGLRAVTVSVFPCSLGMESWHFANPFKPEKCIPGATNANLHPVNDLFIIIMIVFSQFQPTPIYFLQPGWSHDDLSGILHRQSNRRPDGPADWQGFGKEDSVPWTLPGTQAEQSAIDWRFWRLAKVSACVTLSPFFVLFMSVLLCLPPNFPSLTMFSSE